MLEEVARGGYRGAVVARVGGQLGVVERVEGADRTASGIPAVARAVAQVAPAEGGVVEPDLAVGAAGGEAHAVVVEAGRVGRVGRGRGRVVVRQVCVAADRLGALAQHGRPEALRRERVAVGVGQQLSAGDRLGGRVLVVDRHRHRVERGRVGGAPGAAGVGYVDDEVGVVGAAELAGGPCPAPQVRGVPERVLRTGRRRRQRARRLRRGEAGAAVLAQRDIDACRRSDWLWR